MSESRPSDWPQSPLKSAVPLSTPLNVLCGENSKLCLQLVSAFISALDRRHSVNITGSKILDCTFIVTFALILFRDLRCLFSLFLVYFTYILSKLIRQDKSILHLQSAAMKALVPKGNKRCPFPMQRRCQVPCVRPISKAVFQHRAHMILPCLRPCSESPGMQPLLRGT